jgi:alkanesulfonate monooxygenase SsuD/methylene tetrahydromethanopterin reductase-like flavin-dependent oxidoreductase (luciferase family)
MPIVRFGVSVPNIGELGTLIELGVEADRAGWDGFFLWDHMRLSKDFQVAVFDPWVALGAIAVRTEHVRIGTLVTPIPRRRPWKLARETVTLDHLSGGRAILGVGLGYPPDADFELLGEDPDDRVRAAKLDEGLEVLTRLWSGESVDLDGEHFRVRDTAFHPGPVQRPRIPIWVAGMWPNRAPFRRAARFDGVVPIKVEGGMPAPLDAAELTEVVAYVRTHRTSDDPFDVIHGGPADPDGVRASEAAGATWYLAHAGVEGPGWEEPTLELVRAGPPSV